MNEVVSNVIGLFALLFYAVFLVLIIWGFYVMYLATKALQKYLRS